MDDNQLLEEIRAVGTKVDKLQIKLLGDSEAENEHGRLPRLEKTVDGHGARLAVLEGTDNERRGYARGAAAVGAIVGSAVTALIVWITHAFELVKR